MSTKILYSPPKTLQREKPGRLLYTQWFTSNEWNLAEVTVCDLGDETDESPVASFPLSWITHCRSGQLPWREDTQAAYGEVLKVVNKWGLQPRAMWASHAGTKSSSPGLALHDCNPGRCTDHDLAPEFLTRRIYEIKMLVVSNCYG